MRIRLALLATAAIFSASSVMAADMPVARKAAPVAVQGAYSWTGLYVGAHIGAGWSTTESRLNGLTIGPASVPLGLPLASHTGNGFLGGAQVGFNYQVGTNLVLGVEADGTWTDLKGSAPCLAVLTCTDRTKWMATAAGRVGFVLDRTMIFVKGGAAWAKHDHNVNLSLVGVTLDASASETRTGWLIGTGVEQALGYGWSAKVEYNYIDFGSKDLNAPVSITGAGVVPPITAATSFSDRTHIVKGGLNYKFGGN